MFSLPPTVLPYLFIIFAALVCFSFAGYFQAREKDEKKRFSRRAELIILAIASLLIGLGSLYLGDSNAEKGLLTLLLRTGISFACNAGAYYFFRLFKGSEK